MTWNIDNIDSLAAKTCIVTGANSGIGFETAKAFGENLHVELLLALSVRQACLIGNSEGALLRDLGVQLVGARAYTEGPRSRRHATSGKKRKTTIM